MRGEEGDRYRAIARVDRMMRHRPRCARHLPAPNAAAPAPPRRFSSSTQRSQASNCTLVVQTGARERQRPSRPAARRAWQTSKQTASPPRAALARPLPPPCAPPPPLVSPPTSQHVCLALLWRGDKGAGCAGEAGGAAARVDSSRRGDERAFARRRRAHFPAARDARVSSTGTRQW